MSPLEETILKIKVLAKISGYGFQELRFPNLMLYACFLAIRLLLIFSLVIKGNSPLEREQEKLNFLLFNTCMIHILRENYDTIVWVGSLTVPLFLHTELHIV